jgi:heptose I phosphotransferase
MSAGSLWERLVRGTHWIWLNDRYRSVLPSDLAATVMALHSDDRYHAKQGRMTARFRFRSDAGEVSVYLKRHERLPWRARVGALLDPNGCHSPAVAEWAHLERVRVMGLAVPEVVAAGERIGPWGALQSFLMVAELTGCRELNEALPELMATQPPDDFARLKRGLAAEMARMVALLHGANVFHKDLYLCHFLISMDAPLSRPPKLFLIDLHRLAEHRWTTLRWRWKDLGQLLFSTFGVPGIEARDWFRFWKHYRRRARLWLPRWQGRIVRWKAKRYFNHNR